MTIREPDKGRSDNCEWCGNPATTSVTVDPGGGNITINLLLGKGKMVRPPRHAPACESCRDRLVAQPKSIEKARRVKADSDGQTTIFDFLGDA